MDKKLYRSNHQKMLAGVCGGVAEYFNIDVTLVRLIWAIASLPSFGAGLVIYIIAAIVVPERPYGQQDYTVYERNNTPIDNSKVLTILGAILVIIGVISLISGLFPFLWRVIKNGFWPAIIIIIGIALIYSSWKNRSNG